VLPVYSPPPPHFCVANIPVDCCSFSDAPVRCAPLYSGRVDGGISTCAVTTTPLTLPLSCYAPPSRLRTAAARRCGLLPGTSPLTTRTLLHLLRTVSTAAHGTRAPLATRAYLAHTVGRGATYRLNARTYRLLPRWVLRSDCGCAPLPFYALRAHFTAACTAFPCTPPCFSSHMPRATPRIPDAYFLPAQAGMVRS